MMRWSIRKALRSTFLPSARLCEIGRVEVVAEGLDAQAAKEGVLFDSAAGISVMYPKRRASL